MFGSFSFVKKIILRTCNRGNTCTISELLGCFQLNDSDVVKLADVGLTKPERDISGTICGSTCYSAPEVRAAIHSHRRGSVPGMKVQSVSCLGFLGCQAISLHRSSVKSVGRNRLQSVEKHTSLVRAGAGGPGVQQGSGHLQPVDDRVGTVVRYARLRQHHASRASAREPRGRHPRR